LASEHVRAAYLGVKSVMRDDTAVSGG
jgi:hypothetical protein